jgi:hypothetical protein
MLAGRRFDSERRSWLGMEEEKRKRWGSIGTSSL